MIKKLPQDVINKIAAEQVIQRPQNVIKELVENSIDANSTSIFIFINQGGLKSIRITDNGDGIRVEDFPLLCIRHATSKIFDLSDLERLCSFGFRGQALASLSYVSQLQIVSKFKDAKLAYKGEYKDQKLVSDPQPASFNVGTRITANQLFFNRQTRRASLNPAQQKKKILKLINHFSLHYSSIKFRLESEKGLEISTQNIGIGGNSKLLQSQRKMHIFQQLTKLSFDKFIYYQKKELKDVEIALQGIFTKINSIKGKTILLNVNNRIVDNLELKRAVQKAYSQCYRSIHEQVETYYVYLSITIDPKRIDCNIHPSKKIIGFFNADKIYQEIYQEILNTIKMESAIKILKTNELKQNQLMTNQPSHENQYFNRIKIPLQPSQQIKQQKNQSKQQIYAYQKNRTDPKLLPLGFYFGQNHSKPKQENMSNQSDTGNFQYNLIQDNRQFDNKECMINKFFKALTYVGSFNLNYIFIHYDNKLFMLNLLPFIPGFLRYWLRNHQLIYRKVQQKINIKQQLLEFYKDQNLNDKIGIQYQKLIELIFELRSEFLNKYGIKFSENGNLELIPIITNFIPDTVKTSDLCYFLTKIAIGKLSQVQNEELFLNYLSCQFENQSNLLSPFNNTYNQFMRNQLIPLMKLKVKYGQRARSIQITQYLKQMLDLKDVYKIFERC